MDKKISTSIIETYITTQEHQILHEKPFGTGKNHGVLRLIHYVKYRDYNNQVNTKLEFTFYNKLEDTTINLKE